MVTPVEEALRRRLGALAPASRARLLRLLNLPTAEPATLIEALYPDSEFAPLRHFLLELEEDLPTLVAVVAELRRMERDDYLHSLGSGTMGRIHARSVSPISAHSRMTRVGSSRADVRDERHAEGTEASRGSTAPSSPPSRVPMSWAQKEVPMSNKGKKGKKGKKAAAKKANTTNNKAKNRSKKLVKQAKRRSKQLLRDAEKRAKKVAPKVRDLVHPSS